MSRLIFLSLFSFSLRALAAGSLGPQQQDIFFQIKKKVFKTKNSYQSTPMLEFSSSEP